MSDEAIDRSKLPIRRPQFQGPGSGGVIAVYDTGGAETVDKALANAVKKSVAQIDGMCAKKLKTGLAEAQAGMGG